MDVEIIALHNQDQSGIELIYIIMLLCTIEVNQLSKRHLMNYQGNCMKAKDICRILMLEREKSPIAYFLYYRPCSCNNEISKKEFFEKYCSINQYY